ncbi:MAG: chorismate-binding protein [Proteobacteria bacterium]|nr:chorismate-binding protein [Pseudomonadota bacterium]
MREAARLAFSQGACGLLLLATHEAVAEFETVPVHPDWRALPRLQLWSARSLQQLAPSDETPGGWGAPTAMPQLHPTVSSQGQAVTSSEEGDGRERWHASAVEKAREAIAAGRLYQLCLTFPLRFAPPEDPAALFAWLMSQHPVDHGAWLHLPGRGDRPGLELLSASPERFFALRGREVTARPMKGTRRITPETAEALMRELASSSKDRAENVMIADLVRNDLGRVCVAGSVRAESLWEVERYASVAQMTSTITGELRSGLDVFDVFAAAFPPGSMTGAPKIEACRMIHELESGPRGLYGGAIGWLDPSGDASFSVVIRTLQISGDEARWDIGGGIVHGPLRASGRRLRPSRRLCGGCAMVGHRYQRSLQEVTGDARFHADAGARGRGGVGGPMALLQGGCPRTLQHPAAGGGWAIGGTVVAR